MHIIGTNIKWIMLAAGALTCTMALAIVAPELAMQRTFGASLSGPLAEVIVRSWGVLITLTGAMLIYAAYTPVHRKLVLLVATVSKTALLALIAGLGGQYAVAAMPVIILDGLMVVIFSLYLLSAKQHGEGIPEAR